MMINQEKYIEVFFSFLDDFEGFLRGFTTFKKKIKYNHHLFESVVFFAASDHCMFL